VDVSLSRLLLSSTEPAEFFGTGFSILLLVFSIPLIFAFSLLLSASYLILINFEMVFLVFKDAYMAHLVSIFAF
jgi:hypothetical protein